MLFPTTEVFESDDITYVAVAAISDNSVGVIDQTDLSSPTAVASITDMYLSHLNGAIALDVFESCGGIYASACIRR